MFKVIVVSFFAACLLASGCASDNAGRRHQGCHRTGVHRAGRRGTIHHHYKNPEHRAVEKAK